MSFHENMSSRKSNLMIPNLPEITITQSTELTKRKNPPEQVAKWQPIVSNQVQTVSTKRSKVEYTSSNLGIPGTKHFGPQCQDKEKNNKRSNIQSSRGTLGFKHVANIRYD